MELEALRKELQRCITDIYVWCDNIRAQKISYGDNALPEVISKLEHILKYPQLKLMSEMVLHEFSLFLTAYEEKDYVLAADYMESAVIPILENVAEEIIQSIELPAVKSGYEVEYTSSGAVTLIKNVGNKRKYLHTNLCPGREALHYIERWQDHGIGAYHVAGLAFGYHIEMLSRNPLVQVYVYEEDECVVEIAKQYSDVWEIIAARDNVNVIVDEGYQLFVKKAGSVSENSSREKICVYHPSLQTIANNSLRDKMEKIFLQIDNSERWATNLAVNFYYNITHIEYGVEALKSRFEGKTVYLIAGGPSLDLNIHLLKERKPENIVLTVGTSLRRCITENIRPDVAIITDPKESVYRQISEVEECGIPMILLSTTCFWVARDYKADKYLACQKGYHPAERLAEKKGWLTYETGGSVTTTALDICIKLEAKRVVFLGLDLAFTGGKSHQGVENPDMTAKSDLQVPDINGKMVVTSQNLNMYRQWIEKRIARAKESGCQTEFIDASEGGARVEGTRVARLQEILK